MTYFVLKYLHVIGAAVLLGTGAGIAFFMLMAHLTGKAATIAAVARIVVIADFVFTATAVVAQPVTGLLLTWYVGYALTDAWIVASIVLYAVTGAFWLPVVWMQMQMRDLAQKAAMRGRRVAARATTCCSGGGSRSDFPPLPRCSAIFWLMIARPQALPLFG